MTQEERLIQIKKLLKEKHQLSTRKLAEHFQISFDTARRDVIHLTSTGQDGKKIRPSRSMRFHRFFNYFKTTLSFA